MGPFSPNPDEKKGGEGDVTVSSNAQDFGGAVPLWSSWTTKRREGLKEENLYITLRGEKKKKGIDSLRPGSREALRKRRNERPSSHLGVRGRGKGDHSAPTLRP